MAYNTQLKPDEVISLTDSQNQTIGLRPYLRNNKIWLSIDAPKSVRIEKSNKVRSNNEQRNKRG